jgi:hypothetical protein
MTTRKARPALHIGKESTNNSTSNGVPMKAAPYQQTQRHPGMAQSAPAYTSNVGFFYGSGQRRPSAIDPTLLNDSSMEDISSDILLTESIFPLTIDGVSGGLMDMDDEVENMAFPTSTSRQKTIPEDALFSPTNDFDDFDSLNPSVVSASLPESPYVSSSPIFFGSGGGPMANGMIHQPVIGTSTSSLTRQVPIRPSPQSFTNNATRPMRAGSTASSSAEFDTTAQSFPGVSTSVPSQGVELTKHIEQLEKRRRRRESHNAVERRRRDLINDKIKELSIIVPDCKDEDNMNKGSILCKSVDYIRELTEQNRALTAKVAALEKQLLSQ